MIWQQSMNDSRIVRNVLAGRNEEFARLVHVPFEFDGDGSRVVLYQPDGL